MAKASKSVDPGSGDEEVVMTYNDPTVLMRGDKAVQRRLAGVSVPGYADSIRIGVASRNPLLKHDPRTSVVTDVTRIGDTFHVEREDGTCIELINTPVIAFYELDPLELPLEKNEIEWLAKMMLRKKLQERLNERDAEDLPIKHKRAQIHGQFQKVQVILDAITEQYEREQLRQELNGVTSLSGEPVTVSETDQSGDGPELTP